MNSGWHVPCSISRWLNKPPVEHGKLRTRFLIQDAPAYWIPRHRIHRSLLPRIWKFKRGRSPPNMNRASLVVALAASMVATVGCASKNYVRQQTTPIINKTNELDDLTAQNAKAIKDVDARAKAGTQEVNTREAAAD